METELLGPQRSRNGLPFQPRQGVNYRLSRSSREVDSTAMTCGSQRPLVSLLVKDLQSLIARERRTIRPVTYQSFEAVGHTDDTNKLGNLIPLQAIRIPR